LCLLHPPRRENRLLSGYVIRAMVNTDYVPVRRLWEGTPGVGLNDSDRQHAVERFLERNPAMSAVASVDGRIVGAVLCGHDGRRGYLYHLAVELSHRKTGIGRKLVEWCEQRLEEAGIDKCSIFI